MGAHDSKGVYPKKNGQAEAVLPFKKIIINLNVLLKKKDQTIKLTFLVYNSMKDSTCIDSCNHQCPRDMGTAFSLSPQIPPAISFTPLPTQNPLMSKDVLYHYSFLFQNVQ